MDRKHFVAIFAMTLVSITAADPVQAQWTQYQRNEFTNGCVPACRDNRNLHKRWVSRCDAYCACVMREGESRFTSAQYEILERDARDNVQSQLLQDFSKIYPGCSQRIFSD